MKDHGVALLLYCHLKKLLLFLIIGLFNIIFNIKYLVDDELVGAVGQRPAVLLHQGDEGVAKQLLLPLVFGCGTTITT